MSASPDYAAYAEKMRGQVLAGGDFEVDVRFVDMVAARGSVILDVGCGIGNAVNGMRLRGHEAFGVDPTPELLAVAGDLYEPSWFRQLGVNDLSTDALQAAGLPTRYDVILMSGNVPAFLTPEELQAAFALAGEVLLRGGVVVIGTTAHLRGGVVDLDSAAHPSGLQLQQRFSDWHLAPFTAESAWSVSVFSRGEAREFAQPDGQFVLVPKA